METLIAYVFNYRLQKIQPLRIFLDGGSNLSCISKEAKSKLDLNSNGVEFLRFSTFSGGFQSGMVEKCLVRLYQDKEGAKVGVTCDLYCLKNIVDPVQAFEFSKEQIQVLKKENIRLADPSVGIEECLPVDILIGQDYINEFYLGDRRPMAEGAVLVPTWNNSFIVSGPVKNTTKFFSKINQAPKFLVCQKFSKTRTMETNIKKLKETALSMTTYNQVSSEVEMEIINTFKNFEALGINHLNYEINPLWNEFNKSVRLDESRYIISLPFKNPQIASLSPNFYQAFSRLLTGYKKRLHNKHEDI